jgi:hypothetical protein
MSNVIFVKVNNKVSPFPFKWDSDILMAFIKNEWRAVWKTSKKTRYGDRIFELAS